MDFLKFQIKFPKIKFSQNPIFWSILISFFISSIFGFIAGGLAGTSFFPSLKDYVEKIASQKSAEKIIEKETIVKEYIPPTTQEQQVINVVKSASPAVVSVVAMKDVPVVEQYYADPFKEFEQFFGPGFGSGFQIPQYRQKGTEKKEVSAGTGFIVSSDGLILTNKHVVLDEQADYVVFTVDGKKYEAKVLARDPFQDLAILKIQTGLNLSGDGANISKDKLSVLILGDSDSLQIGQTVIAIGNALGEFRNTVSVGVISGLSRTIIASGAGLSETLEDIIQTDAALNPGNSGGPILNLRGEVIGVNVAIASGAQSIGFSIPINKAKIDIESVKAKGKIVYPFLGVRYVLVNAAIKEKNKLPYDYGALVLRGEAQEDLAVVPGSSADKAGIVENDIILEADGKKITAENPLAKTLSRHSVNDKITLKIWHKGEEKTVEIILGERD